MDSLSTQTVRNIEDLLAASLAGFGEIFITDSVYWLTGFRYTDFVVLLAFLPIMHRHPALLGAGMIALCRSMLLIIKIIEERTSFKIGY